MEYPNWFAKVQDSFHRNLGQFAAQDNVKFLQIGAYTGDASLWMLENILTGSGSELYDVDTWAGSEEDIHKTFNWAEIENIHNEKTSKFNNLIKLRGDSKTVLPKLLEEKRESFDFIYVDGSHKMLDVYDDARYAWPLLKQGGLMSFDDYGWNGMNVEVQMGADRFLHDVYHQVDIIERGLQLWVVKR
jgi:predicted O-methyltransferase YrrM